jgi:hypothetical protein
VARDMIGGNVSCTYNGTAAALGLACMSLLNTPDLGSRLTVHATSGHRVYDLGSPSDGMKIESRRNAMTTRGRKQRQGDVSCAAPRRMQPEA